MARDSTDFTEDLPDPGWRERLAAVKRSADALLSTRAAIFREELAEKGALFGQAAAGLVALNRDPGRRVVADNIAAVHRGVDAGRLL